MTPPWPRATDADLVELMAGNEDAARLVRDIVFLSHTYDDLIDADKPVPAEHIHALMWKLLHAMPQNPFYRQHEDMFRGVIIAAQLNWHAATAMERAGELEELRLAHVLRYSIADVAMLAMAIAGGQDHAMKNARRCRLLSQFDTWAHYKGEHYEAQDTAPA
jgi:hypothetical protein